MGAGFLVALGAGLGAACGAGAGAGLGAGFGAGAGGGAADRACMKSSVYIRGLRSLPCQVMLSAP
ncbi:MAG: hypothetical protein E6J39_04260 [Chloroflexi bacterium]|nr:MAG: hypothetical protein E6J39_04260 [Chloroflexota bacterium]